MEIELNPTDFKKQLDRFSYKNNGDKEEKKKGNHVIDLFPNSERFWRLFVVPMTNRIDDNYIGNEDNRIGLRKILFATSTDLIDIQRINYSILFNLISAYDCIEDKKRISCFEDFYAHLGTICDLAEEFIIQIYILLLNCDNRLKEKHPKLTLSEFLKIAEKWYLKKYPELYENFLNRGSNMPIYLPSKSSYIKKYLNDKIIFNKYNDFIQTVKKYRNSIVHNPKIPGHLKEENIYVPRKERIKYYKKWHQVHAIDPIVNEDVFKADFIEQFELMQGDFKTMKERLNELWEKPINDLEQLFYVDQNEVLMKKYDLHFMK